MTTSRPSGQLAMLELPRAMAELSLLPFAAPMLLPVPSGDGLPHAAREPELTGAVPGRCEVEAGDD